MNSGLRRISALLSVAFWGALCATPAWAIKEGEVYKDWTVGCEKLPNDENRCFIYQTIKDNDDKPVLLVAVGYLPADSKAAAVFTVPLGVVIPPGLGVKVDGGKALRVGYERCLPQGCIAALPLEDDLVKRLKRGSKMEIIVFDNKGAVAIPKPVSLSGFTKGFDALEK